MDTEGAPPPIVGVGHRLTQPPSSVMAATAFAHELKATAHLQLGFTEADLAHLCALRDIGVVDESTFETIGKALLALDAETPDGRLDGRAGDFYNNRTTLLKDRIGDIVDKLHTGRARRETTTVAWQIACRTQLLQLWGATGALASELVATAALERRTLCPDFTYLQHAHVTTLGHYLMGAAYPIVRCLDRLAEAYGRLNECSAGSGSVNGTRIPIDRVRFAERLGFDAPLPHTRDAMWQPDLAIELSAVCTSVMVAVARLAEDLFVWATAEFGLFTCSDAHSRASVIMPQKKNPYALAYLRGVARAGSGDLQAVVATQCSPTGQPDNRTHAYRTVGDQLETASGACDLLAEVVREGTFEREVMQRSSLTGFHVATDLCDHLTLEHGMSNRAAHDLVGSAVRMAVEQAADELDEAHLAAAADDYGMDWTALAPGDWHEFTDPRSLIEARRTQGGASSDSMDHMLESLTTRIESSLHVRATIDAHLKAASLRLVAEVERVSE